jgi:prolipoprotein diacylglyceryl transferase
LDFEVALWSTIAGVIGGRLYFDIATPDQMGHQWYAPIAVWQGGLGIWGAVLLGGLVGAFIVHRRGVSVSLFMDAAAPALPLASGIGRLGNWFNQELFGGPTSLPWGQRIDPHYRPSHYATVSTFLYKMLLDFALAAFLPVLSALPDPPALFCLYVCVYCVIRLLMGLLRVDPASVFFGERLNSSVARTRVTAGGVLFALFQRLRPTPHSHQAASSA